jgi:hypothetical protein
MSQSPDTRRHAVTGPNPAIVYLSAVIVSSVIVAFAWIFAKEIWHGWHPPVPDWILALHNPLNALAALVGGIVAVAFAVKKPPQEKRSLRTSRTANLVSLGAFVAPSVDDKLKVALGTIYAAVYVGLGLMAIGTWAYVGSVQTPADVKGLATNFAGMITPIVLAFFSERAVIG